MKYIKKNQGLHEKYLSPYLEPLISYKKTWYENEKIKLFNKKVNAQRKREKLRKNIMNDLKLQQVENS